MNQIILQLTQDFDPLGSIKVYQLIIAGLFPLSVIALFIALSIKEKRKTANY